MSDDVDLVIAQVEFTTHAIGAIKSVARAAQTLAAKVGRELTRDQAIAALKKIAAEELEKLR